MSSENIIINTIDMKKDKRREYMKEYDKDRYRPAYYEEKRAEKKYCICGCLVKREYMFLHTETQKHEKMLKHQTPEMRISCPCCSEFQKKEQNRHEKCMQHIEYLKTLNKSQ